MEITQTKVDENETKIEFSGSIVVITEEIKEFENELHAVLDNYRI